MAAGAKRRWQHLPRAMCWGDPVTPSCPRGICPPRRGKTHGEGARGGLCVPISRQRTGWGRGNCFLAVGGAHLQGVARIPSARLDPDTGAARALLSIGRAARSPSGASRPPCLAQATARSPSLPDAALAPAGIQQPSPAGAPRCLPITHERCRADSSRDGRELPETPTGPRRPHAFASCALGDPKGHPTGDPSKEQPPGFCSPAALPAAALHTPTPQLLPQLEDILWEQDGDKLGEGALSQSPTRQRMLHSLRPPSTISPESPNHCGDTAVGTPTPPQQAEAEGWSILPGLAQREPSPGLVTGAASTHVTINIPHRHRSICMIRWGDDFSTDHWK